MKTLIVILAFTLPLFTVSCKDEGKEVEYLHVVSLHPAPNAANVDKAQWIEIELDRSVHSSSMEQIGIRYLDTPDPIHNIVGCGLSPAENTTLCIGPFLWKPGRTVEVTLPATLSDPDGRRLKEPVVYQFSVASDKVPFQLLDVVPQEGDTVTVFPGMLFHGSLTFSDYLEVPDSALTITPPAEIHVDVVIVVDGRPTPSRTVHFSLGNLQPNLSYTIGIPAQIEDYEGESLPQDYQLTFHTKP